MGERTETFPKSSRLRKRREFIYTQQRGHRLALDRAFVYIAKTRGGPIRLGLTVSKKVGKASQRNRVKRVLREAFRTSDLRHQMGYQIVIIAKQGYAPLTLNEARDTFKALQIRLERGIEFGRKKRTSGKDRKNKTLKNDQAK